MPGPNGEPSGMSAGGWAVTRALQHGQNRLIRVVIGLMGARSNFTSRPKSDRSILPPREGFTVAHFLTVADVERSLRFYEGSSEVAS
jgi:hypothetical protein